MATEISSRNPFINQVNRYRGRWLAFCIKCFNGTFRRPSLWPREIAGSSEGRAVVFIIITLFSQDFCGFREPQQAKMHFVNYLSIL